MKLDELPPELLFKISTYLTLFDIGYSLMGVSNHLDKLFAENKNDHRTLAFHDGRCSYSLYRAFLDDHNGFRTRCLSIFIRSLVLGGFCNITCAYGILSKWADSTPSFLPSVRILTLSNMQFFHKYCYKPLALILACGMENWNETGRGSLYVLHGVCGRQSCFLRTVYLTLSLKRFTELLFLLQPNEMPCLKHLTVTFERSDSTVSNLEHLYEPKNILSQSYLVTMNVIHLHTLTLRGGHDSDFSMDNVLLIIRHLKMPNLKSLTLIHVQTSLLNQLVEFRQAIHSSSLWLSLDDFRFSLCLPIALRHEYETTEFGDFVFNTSDWLARGWCVRHIVEEHLSSAMLLVYTCPCDLQNDRILVNHRFVTRTINHDRRATVQHMVWLCRNTDNDGINLHSADNVKHSLAVLSRVYHLKWHWAVTTTGFAISRDPCFLSLRLRSFHLQMIGIDDTQIVIYANLLRNLLANAVLLQRLSAPWRVVRELGRCCSSSTASYRLRSLFLYFEQPQPNPGHPRPSAEPVDDSILALLFPHLRHLSLYGGFYRMDKPLVNMLQNLIDSFTSVNQYFNMLHASSTLGRAQPFPRSHFVSTEIRKKLCLTRDKSTFSLCIWEHNGVGQLTIWL
ncbi:unnamed protein product [Rotaria socialis]|uniref:F-box domain-containing protein n=2 Tax=Rotaria socialis TaxID=392032 RepID=A0A821B6V3_9BILA|nr:unnamed protein product [Rotaria socialis]